MSAFPAPSSNVPVFNPSLFTSLVSNVVSTSSAPTGTYVDYPNPQGPITFVSGSNQTTIGADNLSIISDVGVGDLGITFGANGLLYNGTTGPLGITWSNLATKIEAIQSLSQASNASTLNVNNTISIQNGETDSLPTQTIVISADASGNRLALDGDYGTIGNVLVSGGENGNLVWGSGGGALVGTLGEVLNNGNVAYRNLDMNGYMIENAILELDSLNIATDPVPSPELTSTGSVLPIVLNGTTYYLQLFSVPP